MGKQGFDRSKGGFSRRPLVLAHRGAATFFPENSLAAFVEARRLGADGVELDVRRSADGALVVHHDRLVPGAGDVAVLTVAELPPGVPLLDAALDACAGMTVNIEVKNLPHEPHWDGAELAARQVAAVVVERGLLANVVVSSFALATIDAVRAAEPEVVTGLLTPPGADQLRALDLAVGAGHRAIHPHHLGLDLALVDAAHDRGLAVTAWTADDAERIRWLAAAGVDGIITNRPDVALAALDGG